MPLDSGVRVALGGGVRDRDDSKRQAIVSIPWEVLDSYKSDFGERAFDAELSHRLPTACWAHLRSEPIGRAIEWQKTNKANELVVQYSDFDAVPRARQAWVQQDEGTIEDWSFGYDRGKHIPHPNGQRGNIRYTSARMVEISPVVAGSIPGATTVGVRMTQEATAEAAGLDIEGLRGLRDDGVITEEEYLQICRSQLQERGLLVPVHRDPEDLAAALRSALDEGRTDEADQLTDELLVAMGVRAAPTKPYGDVQYADPGYQADKKKRYPLDTRAHVIAALSYIGQAKNAGQYSDEDLKKVKAAIEAAAKKLGIGDRSEEDPHTPEGGDTPPVDEPTIDPEIQVRAAQAFGRLGSRGF